MNDLSKQVRFLKIYIALLTIIVLGLGTIVALMVRSQRFRQITAEQVTAERINIVEPDGRLRMVISDQKNQHPGMVDGKTLAARERPAGMIFFNDSGDEDGGIVYDGNSKGASMTYSIDQYKNDQIMQLQYSQDSGRKIASRSYGLKLWDRPDDFTLAQLIGYADSLQKLKDSNAVKAGFDTLRANGKMGYERFFAGKEQGGEVGLFLRDSKGIPRLKIYIDTNDQPVIEKLDKSGKVLAVF
jgi:hypothetical protein